MRYLSMTFICDFAAFIMDPVSLEGRLTLTLTVVLGLNVYQIVILDSMPTTGYLTRMHEFTVYSTILVVVVAVQVRNCSFAALSAVDPRVLVFASRMLCCTSPTSAQSV